MTAALLEAERVRLLPKLRDGSADGLPPAELDRIYAELYRVERNLRRRPTSGSRR